MQVVSVERKTAGTSWLSFTIAFMVIDLCQLQLMVRPLSAVRPGLIVTVVLAAYVFCNWPLVRKLWLKQLTYTVLFAFLLICLTALASNNYRAFMTGRSMLLMLPFLISLSTVIHNSQRLHVVLKSLEWILLVVAFYSLSHGGKGPGGMMSDENDLTLFIVTIFPFSFYLFSVAGGAKAKVFHVTVMAVSLLAVVQAFSRGGFVGLVGMFFAYWLFSKKKKIVLVAIGIIFAFLYIVGGDAYFNEMKTVTDADDSTANERILSWEAGWDMFLDNPLGVGGNNFPVRFPEYQPEEMRRNMWGRAAHSLWFTLIPETGVLGILLFAFLIMRNFRDIRDIVMGKPECAPEKQASLMNCEELGIAYAAGLIGFLGAASFISVLYYTHIWYLSVLVGASRRVLYRN